MFIAFTVVSIFMTEFSPLLGMIIFSSAIIVVVGVIDDIYELSPYLRLFIVWPVATLLTIGGGLTFYMTNPLGEGLIYFDFLVTKTGLPFYPELIFPAHLIIMVWIIWVINMVKLTKGASQLPGMAFFAFLTIAAVSLKYASGNPAQYETAVLAMIMAGAVLAFVPFNFPPERIFPGDSASAFIGFMLGVLSILSGGKLATAFIVMGIPAIDMVATIFFRLIQGKNPLTSAGRDHLYHKLMDLGMDKRLVILIYWMFTAILGAISILLNNSREKLFVFATIGALTLGVFVVSHYWIQRQINSQNELN